MPDYPSGTPLWLFVIVALIPAVSSIVVAVISSHKLDQASASNKADNEDLKSAIEDELKESSTIRRMDEKLDNDWEHGQELDRQVAEVKLMILRQDLFAPITDRAGHEHAIQSGEEYVRLGGNGIGHLRLEWLKQRWQWRQDHDDWNYTHDDQQNKEKEP